MKGPGLLWMFQTAAGLSMAGPMFVIGFDLFRSGETAIGVGFFAIGAVALYLPTYLIQRIGGPRTWIRRRLGRSGGESSTDASAPSSGGSNADFEGESASRANSNGAGLLERLRRR
ncbi:hypothetical protein D8Y22_07570 [Salinadaptatus halalkaliphilus]|uniref:Uncharacterized protein n=1 Tax=Salinadaptatus halalkaliphilus TaxID=2419781 RepID=A0A4S3TLW9_9EURY|nr:hypothetical protein [Salinadaptatus halalkaliphilus]THE65076.1 hypothetical protein D8Y22_07570 [Salinadaptatus halalkaliphilus]